MKGSTLTVDMQKAIRQLNAAKKQITKTNLRGAARKAAQIARDEMRSKSGPVPVYKKARYHYFKRRGGSTIKIRAGNLRNSCRVNIFKDSKLLWVGPKYTKDKLAVMGETVATSFGFYAGMMMKKTGTNFIAETKARKSIQIQNRLKMDGDALMKKVAAKANATP